MTRRGRPVHLPRQGAYWVRSLVLVPITGTIPTWYHHDQLGSTRVLTDNTGAVVGAFTYDPYGKTTSATGTATTPIGYAGAYKDTESGFLYLINRYYDPVTAQFLTRDPLDSLTQSAYGYVDGNPLNSTDPLGLCKGVLGCLGAAWNHTGGKVLHKAAELGNSIQGFLNDVIPGGVDPSVPQSNCSNLKLSYGIVFPFDDPGDLGADPGLPGPGDIPTKVVNSNMPHAADQAAERLGFDNVQSARAALQELGRSIETSGFPEGTIPDSNPGRVLVPFGNGGYAVYQIAKNGNAVLKTVLVAR